jgi:hypothetical protein
MRRALAIATIFAAAWAYASDMIVVNVHQSDERIKAQLLRETPLGTTATEVYQFLQHRLRHAPGTQVAGAPGQPYRSNMMVELGHYITRESFSTLGPMLVQAAWRFDERDKLRDIEVRRFMTGI